VFSDCAQACVVGPGLSLKIKQRWKDEDSIIQSNKNSTNCENMTYEQTLEHQAKVAEALKALDTVTPVNLHLKTNADYTQRENFHSIWFNHTPQAARYYLLPSFWAGKLFILQ
jgi:long-subunit acyl-CoA synthetase (AMP-forming)